MVGIGQTKHCQIYPQSPSKSLFAIGLNCLCIDPFVLSLKSVLAFRLSFHLPNLLQIPILYYYNSLINSQPFPIGKFIVLSRQLPQVYFHCSYIFTMTATIISETKAKSLFRAASKIRPESIVTLKRSIAKSNSNLLSFASHIQNCHSLKRKTTQISKGEEQDSWINQIHSQRKDLNLDVFAVKESVFVRANANNKTNIKKKLKIYRERIHLNNESEQQQKRKNIVHSSIMSNQRRSHFRPNSDYENLSYRPNSLELLRKNKNSLEYTQTQRQRLHSQISQLYFERADIQRQKHKETSGNQRFWKKRGKTWGCQGKKGSTEAKEIKGGTNLTDLIQFDPRENQKAVNYLVLQLQVNLACEKKNKITLTYK